MENYLYTCQYCAKQYKPNRRKKQKYCSNSCRTRAHVLKNGKALMIPSTQIKENKPNQIEKMSLAGVGNAAAGTLAVNLVTSLFTNEENKPATKKDLYELMDALKERFHPINNMPPRIDGARPYYDYEAKSLIYLKNNQE